MHHGFGIARIDFNSVKISIIRFFSCGKLFLMRGAKFELQNVISGT